MIRQILALLLLTITVSAQGGRTKPAYYDPPEQVFPSRINNYCLSDNAVATASSFIPGYEPEGAIDGDRIGQNCNFNGNVSPCWGNHGGWADNTYETWPDSLTVTLGRNHSIGRIVMVTFQDNYSTPRIEPYLGLAVGNNYGIKAYKLEVYDITGNWVEVANVPYNHDIIREHTFTPMIGSAIRITITEGVASFSRIIELEAYSV